jgi:hypothetical protein
MARAFVLMPFAAEFSEIYNLFIARALDRAGYEVMRADDIVSQQNILHDIVSYIATSDLIVADLTGSNPNVYYELGIAHALRKPVVLLTQSVEELPFDLRPYRVIPYNTHFAAIQKAEIELAKLAVGARDGTVSFGSPVRDFLSDQEIGAVTPYNPATPNGEDPELELGLIDHLVTIEEGFEQLTAVLGRISEGMAEMTGRVSETSEQLDRANANEGSGSTRHKQSIMRKLAKYQDTFASYLATRTGEYNGVLSGIENSLEAVVSAATAETVEERAQLEEMLQSLSEMEDSAIEAQKTYVGLARTIDETGNFERHLTRANQRVSSEVRQLANSIDQTIAILSRARAVGERILKSHVTRVE